MGRHRANHEDKQQADTRRQVRRERVRRQPVPRQKNPDLLLWGIFLAVTAVGAMTWAEIDWRVTAAVSFLLLLAFTAAWQFTPVTPAAETADQAPALTPALTPASIQPAATPAEATPSEPDTAQKPAPAPKPPITRKEMRAADPTTGVLPVVSVLARKPAATASGIPLAPAGQVLQGIDTGQPNPHSRKARRRAEASRTAAAVPAAETAKPAGAVVVPPKPENADRLQESQPAS